MDCAFDDDRTIVVAMVDFAISTIFGLIYSYKLLASTAIFSNSFDLYGHLNKYCVPDYIFTWTFT